MTSSEKSLKAEIISQIIQYHAKIRKLEQALENLRFLCKHEDAVKSFEVGKFDVKLCPDCGSKVTKLNEKIKDTTDG